ncbi:WD repeat-containing protein 3-like [Xenopus laevis]|uniref:WD repeat-containing protein 3-like n=1 Tax=Xenopus laevis TaxID=8355 RepID=A0A8J1M7T1_XENLA|nr:WD repeat-containing protein 3-like [Xenopus laevis]
MMPGRGGRTLFLTLCLIDSELEESLLVLLFSLVPDALALFRDYIRQGGDVELTCRCLFFLLRIQFGQITSNQMLLGVNEDLKNCIISWVAEVRDMMGVNMAALQFLKREVGAKEEVQFFADATERLKGEKEEEEKE